jgi:4-amino-4-deoxy-L-arabinose transferase-like glycosyltransferase
MGIVQLCKYVLDAIPVLLPLALVTFGITAISFLLFGQLRSLYVWTIGSCITLIAFVVIGRYYRVAIDREHHVCNILVSLAVCVWGLLNTHFNAQHIITNRDPGTYVNASLWLVTHTSLRISTPTIFSHLHTVAVSSPGFASYTNHGKTYLYAQGLHLLPAFMGLAGRLVGTRYMFDTNILFGMTALLAFYGLSRLLVRPFWALIATGALAASMPFLYFSRDAYTELLAATFTFGALALLKLALQSRKSVVWLLVGLMTGAGTLTRVDGLLTVAAMVIFACIFLALLEESERPRALRNMVSLLIGAAITAILGWLDLSILSHSYYEGIGSQFWDEIILIGGSLLVGVPCIALAWHSHFLQWINKHTQNWRSIAAPAVIIGAALILVSRPLWTFGPHELLTTAPQWIVWYLGPILAILGLLGLAYAASRIVTSRQPLLLATFLVVALTCAVYITNPSISPDQIWAARRLVPVILPGMALFGVIFLEYIDRQYRQCLEVRWRYLLFFFVGSSLVLGPLLTSRPELIDHDTDLLGQMQTICQALPKHSIVLWLGRAQSDLIQPTTSLCGVPAVGYITASGQMTVPDRAELATIADTAKARGYTLIAGIYGAQTGLLSSSQQEGMLFATSFNYEELATPFDEPPVSTQTINNTIKLGVVQSNGVITALMP